MWMSWRLVSLFLCSLTPQMDHTVGVYSTFILDPEASLNVGYIFFQTAQQLFPPGCESPKLKWTWPPVNTQYKPPSSWNTDHPISPTNTLCLFVQFWVCFSQVSGPSKPPVVAHSPLCALDPFYTHAHACTTWHFVSLSPRVAERQ